MAWNDNDNGSDQMNGEQVASGEVGENDSTQTVESPSENSETQSNDESEDTPRRRTRTKRPVTFDRAFAERFMEAERVLETEEGRALAQFITGSNSSNVPQLLALLNKRENRNQVKMLHEALSKLEGANQITVAVVLTDIFGRDPSMRNMIFRILNAAAHDKNFGHSTGDNTKDALAISAKWDDSIDLSIIGKLIL